MKILIVNTSDIGGGAARAAYRLHKGLRSLGLNSEMFVMAKFSNDNSVVTSATFFRKLLGKIAIIFDIIIRHFLKTKNTVLHSPAILSMINIPKIETMNPDIVSLHWICGGFVKPKDLNKIKKPIVWTLHDMWTFCGAEHYIGKCTRYIDGYLSDNRPKGEGGFDINRWAWNRKKKAWKNLENITIVTPSKWLAECAKKSILLKKYRIEVIPNGIETDIFRPIDKKNARKEIGVPLDKKLILFGAMGATSDPRKGFEYLRQALDIINSKKRNNIEIVIFGSSGSSEDDLPFPAHYMGNISEDDRLALIYSACDVMVTPSLEDNLPNTIMESLSCGTPCVGFNLGGIPDLIDHKKNGYLAEYKNPKDLAEGIEWIINNERHRELCQNARRKVEENFDIKLVAGRYGKLYSKILDNK